MASAAVKSGDEYDAMFPEKVQAILQRIRGTVRRALPGAEEVISYGMPAFKMHGEVILWFAAWKRHYSLYPVNGRLFEAFKRELEPYVVEKGTLRFPLSEPVPVKLIGRIAKFRAKEVGWGGHMAGK
jgi:uncharacterized protein YdhG (YjbR/CyaY superfamily)